MKTKYLGILRCPACGGKLSAGHTEGTEIKEGTLACGKCGKHYPVKDGIPDFIGEGQKAGE